MSRQKRIAQMRGALARDRWGVLSSLIDDGKLIPIISNSVANNPVFDIDWDSRLGISRDMDDEECKGIDRACEEYPLKIDEQLARMWADTVGYPLAEKPLQLSRVAQYCRVEAGRLQAKKSYLSFLKLYLLLLAEDDEEKEVEDVVERLMEPLKDPRTDNLKEPDKLAAQLEKQSFSEIAFQLGYPKFKNEQSDPLHLLAQLPLPIYVTTSHHDFLEQALDRVGKHPQTVVCDWLDDQDKTLCLIESFGERPDPDKFIECRHEKLKPKPDADSDERVVNPVVYHLYGLEKYPDTIVISEDDYMEFLVKASKSNENIPLGLFEALGDPESSVLLLGYTLRGWDFRALFRGIIQPTIRGSESNLAVQLNPPYHKSEGTEEAERDHLKGAAQQYLESYLHSSRFNVEWSTTTSFVKDLWQKWRKRHSEREVEETSQ
jgi:hypothetical protein